MVSFDLSEIRPVCESKKLLDYEQKKSCNYIISKFSGLKNAKNAKKDKMKLLMKSVTFKHVIKLFLVVI